MTDLLELLAHPETIVALATFAVSGLTAYLMLPLVRDPQRTRRRSSGSAGRPSAAWAPTTGVEPLDAAPAGGPLGLDGQLQRLNRHIEAGLRAARAAARCHSTADRQIAATEQELHRLLCDLRAIGMSFEPAGDDRSASDAEPLAGRLALAA